MAFKTPFPKPQMKTSKSGNSKAVSIEICSHLFALIELMDQSVHVYIATNQCLGKRHLLTQANWANCRFYGASNGFTIGIMCTMACSRTSECYRASLYRKIAPASPSVAARTGAPSCVHIVRFIRYSISLPWDQDSSLSSPEGPV